MSLQELHYKIENVSPGLMMHNPRTADPNDEYAIAKKALTSKRTKTAADQAEIHRLSWYGSLYVNEDGKLYVPSRAIVAMFCKVSFKMCKIARGDIRGALFCFDDPILGYEGPKDIDKLWNNGTGKYVDHRFEIIDKNRIIICRPVFPVWSLDFTLTYEDQAIDEVNVEKMLKAAGYLAGLLERRPEYGRFEIVEKE